MIRPCYRFHVEKMYCRLRAIHEEWYWDLLAAGAGVPDPIEQVKQMPRDCPRVLKTHFSVDMLPDQVMQKRNKVISEYLKKVFAQPRHDTDS